MKWIKRNIPWLITALCTFVSFVLWLVFQNHPNLTSLFINLTAGFFVSTFTICIIDRIIQKQREKDIMPLQLALYRDVQFFTSRLISLWNEMYTASSEKSGKYPVKELFSEKILSYIFYNLDLEQTPNILPPQNWFVYIQAENNVITERGEKILERYNLTASPELLQTIHHIIFDSSFAGERIKMINILRNSDVIDNHPRLTILKCYCPFPDDRDRKEIENLIDWCNTAYPLLKGKTSTIYEIEQEFGTDDPNHKASSKISVQKLSEKEFVDVIVGHGPPPKNYIKRN